MKRYDNIKVLQSPEGKQYRTTTIYPETPISDNDYYIITTAGDRYDNLADQFYNDHTLWWVIASANNSQRASLIVEPGIQLRIPGNIDTIINNYNKINK
jgi:nucleoid-associated protein YgaU